jgi:hypothetical protein
MTNHSVSRGLTVPGGTTDTIMIDFQNGVYTVNGGAVALTDLTAQDSPNWNSYNPADVVPGSGYPSLGAGPILIGAAREAVLAGATVVWDFVCDNDLMKVEIFEDSFTNNYQWVITNTTTLSRLRYVDADNFYDSPVTVGDGHHKLAFTQLYATMAMSVDGNTVEVLSSAAATPAPGIVGLYLDGGSAASFVRSIHIMPPQDDADLPALSSIA